MTIGLETVAGAGPLYLPAGTGAVDAVMILHGSEGAGSGWSHRFAAILAAHGLAALPHAYGEGDVWGAGDIAGVDISAIPAVGRRILDHPRVARLHLLGWSRGGELAMHVGAIGGADLPFASIAAHAAADHVIPAFEIAAFRAGRDRDAGERRAWTWPGRDDRLAPGAPIEIGRYPGPVFLSVGTADEVWDHAMTLRLAERLRAAGNPPELWVAEGQGHAFDFDTEPELWSRLLSFFARA
ncbi:prolyl oligopeptidase family serine peptidase [Rhodobacterales bacterium HKCCE2091]|nr:prolyl oligopeptidase family serine peptidase [Rhodobacterales bacterium HKCCE2091]